MFRRIFLLSLFFCVASGQALASDVKLGYGGLTLNANLELADGKDMTDGIVLITHGLLAHGGMEITKVMQELLKERNLSSLAITLSLGLDDRRGMYDCAALHSHRAGATLDEIAAWIAWLKEKGATDIVLAGHSSGGRQTAWFMAERDDPAVKKVVLIAPGIWTADSGARRYKENFKKDLAPLVARAQALVDAGEGDAMMEKTDFLFCPQATVSAATFISYYGGEPRKDTPHNLPKIKKPVLVVGGSEDRTIVGLREVVGPLADGERLKFVEVEDAGHFFLDLFAEDLADAIAEFVGGSGS